MLVIIAHHYVVNSGVSELFIEGNPLNTLFLQIWGMWGKAAINAFVLVTGYFMCTSRLTWMKVFRLLFEIVSCWAISFIIVAALCGAGTLLDTIPLLFIGVLHGVGGGFTGSFIAFYLFIPILNLIIDRFDSAQLDRFLGLLLGLFVVTVTFFMSSAFSEVGWYATLYLIAARIRLYPSRFTEDARLTSRFFLITVLISVSSVLVLGALGIRLGKPGIAYYFMIDSSKILAFLSGLSCFLFFKNLEIPCSKAINIVASTTFGVFLLHTSSAAMRNLLWGDLLDVPGMYNASLPILVVHAFLSMVGVFVVCSLIDLARQHTLEKPVMSFVSCRRSSIEAGTRTVLERASSRLEPMITLLRSVEDRARR